MKYSMMAVAMVGWLGLSTASAAQGSQAFDIAPQRMTDALNEFARQSGLQVVIDWEDGEGLMVARLAGDFTAEAALKRLLEGTELGYEFLNERTIAIRVLQNPASDGKVSADGVRGERLAQGGTGAASQGEGEVGKGASVSSGGEAADTTKEISEIIVTAQKRKESLQDVPISISVLGGEELDASSASDVRDALNSVPAMDFGSHGQTGGNMISVRGVANGVAVEGSSSATAFYLDGTPYGLIRSAVVPLDADPFDLERIEVLRGPQGTLYGASSLNGVIRVLTQDANTKAFELKARTFLSNTQDGAENYGGNFAVNVPLVQDKLGVRAVVGYRSDSGWIESPIANNVNSSELQSYRLKVRAEPTDTLTIDLSAWHSKSNRGGLPYANEDNRSTSVEDQRNMTKYDVFGAEIVKDFGGFSVSSMMSYMDVLLDGRFDGTPAGATVAVETELTSRIFAEELNIVSQHGGPWRWSLGAFYRDVTDGNLTVRDWFPPLEVSFGDRTIHTDYRDTSKSYAVYGELGRRFFDDKVELSAGLRYFHDKQTLKNFALPLAPVARSTAEAVTPRVVLTWSPTSASSFYASYSQGFRSGIMQSPNIQAQAPQFPAARPDKLYNYEVGTKGSLLNGRLTVEGAVYYIDWPDVQQPVRVVLIADPQGNPQLVGSALVNGGSASGSGAELSFIFRPTAGLELGANLAWNGLTFDGDVVEASGRILFPKGGRLVVSPKYTAGAFARYSFPLGSDGLTGALAISNSYKSAQTSYLLGPAGVYVPTLGNKRFDGGSAKFSITARDRWAARLFVDNITNEHSSPAPIGLGTNPAATEWRERPPPRTVGVQFELNY